jgi:hypothetical protein
MLIKLTNHVRHYMKINGRRHTPRVVVNALRHSTLLRVTIATGSGHYDDLIRGTGGVTPEDKWLEEKDVFASTHAAVEDWILRWMAEDQVRSYLDANDAWFRGKLSQLGEKPEAPVSEKNWGRSLGA